MEELSDYDSFNNDLYIINNINTLFYTTLNSNIYYFIFNTIVKTSYAIVYVLKYIINIESE